MAAGLLAASAGAATAPTGPTPGWEFARWGMTPAQLRAASHGAVHTDKQTGAEVMSGEASMGAFKFTVSVDFVRRGDDPGDNAPSNLVLNAVLLTLDVGSGACADLSAYLRTLYGKPDRILHTGLEGFLWNRQDIGDDVTYSLWPEQPGCTVMFMPLGGFDR